MYVSLMVNAKINLQNAADLAALAGAAEQARVMTMIGIKNYELKKNAKEFAYIVNIYHGWDNLNPAPFKHFEGAGLNFLPPSFCSLDSSSQTLPSDPNTKFFQARPCLNFASVDTPGSNPNAVLYFLNPLDPLTLALNPALSFIQGIIQNSVYSGGPSGAGQIADCAAFHNENKLHLQKDLEIYDKTSETILNQIQTMAGVFNALMGQEFNNDIANPPARVLTEGINPGDMPPPAPPTVGPPTRFREFKRHYLVNPPDIQPFYGIAYQTAVKNISKANQGVQTPGAQPDPNRIFRITQLKTNGLKLTPIYQTYYFPWARFTWVTRQISSAIGVTTGRWCHGHLSPQTPPAFGPLTSGNSFVIDYLPATDGAGWAGISNMPIGVYQDFTIDPSSNDTRADPPVFYAVRLSTEVQLPTFLRALFKPEYRRISAYAAAKPFGASIGPTPQQLFNMELSGGVPTLYRDPSAPFPTYPNFKASGIFNNHFLNPQGPKTLRVELRDSFELEANVVGQPEQAKANARRNAHDHAGISPFGIPQYKIRSWAISPQLHERGEYIFNVSFLNPTGTDMTLPAKLGKTGLDAFHYEYIQNGQTISKALGNPDIDDLLQQRVTQSGVQQTQKRHGYSVRLVPFKDVRQFVTSPIPPPTSTFDIRH